MNNADEKDRLSMDVETLQEHLRSGAPGVVLDVRPAAEYEAWSIPGSVNVDAYEALKRNDPDALAGVDLPEDQQDQQRSTTRSSGSFVAYRPERWSSPLCPRATTTWSGC